MVHTVHYLRGTVHHIYNLFSSIHGVLHHIPDVNHSENTDNCRALGSVTFVHRGLQISEMR
jgi:hypothetical protein